MNNAGKLNRELRGQVLFFVIFIFSCSKVISYRKILLKGGESIVKIEKFADKVVKRFSNSITDRLFQMIQYDPELLREYVRLVSDHTVDVVNPKIAQNLKLHFHLENHGPRNQNPQSGLISSY